MMIRRFLLNKKLNKSAKDCVVNGPLSIHCNVWDHRQIYFFMPLLRFGIGFMQK